MSPDPINAEALVEIAVQALSRVTIHPLPHGRAKLDSAQPATGDRPPHPGIGGALQSWPKEPAHPGFDLGPVDVAIEKSIADLDAINVAIEKAGIDLRDPRSGLIRAVVAKRQSRAQFPAAQLAQDIAIAVRGASKLLSILAPKPAASPETSHT